MAKRGKGKWRGEIPQLNKLKLNVRRDPSAALHDIKPRVKKGKCLVLNERQGAENEKARKKSKGNGDQGNQLELPPTYAEKT